jgi:hypothetical protein
MNTLCRKNAGLNIERGGNYNKHLDGVFYYMVLIVVLFVLSPLFVCSFCLGVHCFRLFVYFSVLARNWLPCCCPARFVIIVR